MWKLLNQRLDAALMHLFDCHQGLTRVTPEWCWRAFRPRLSRGRNHGSGQRLERVALVYIQCGSGGRVRTWLPSPGRKTG